MSRLSLIAAAAATSLLALAAPSVAQTSSDESRWQAAQQRYDSEMTRYRAEYDRYQSVRGSRGGGYYQPQRYGDARQDPYVDDRDEGGYDASRYYRENPRYQERTLADNDRVYRGNDGRYYCKRTDGTTGLIVGAAGGGILGNVIDGGHSRAAGTLIGGALGALAGRAVQRNQEEIRCR